MADVKLVVIYPRPKDFDVSRKCIRRSMCLLQSRN